MEKKYLCLLELEMIRNIHILTVIDTAQLHLKYILGGKKRKYELTSCMP